MKKILFKPEMIRASIEGFKTITRRIARGRKGLGICGYDPQLITDENDKDFGAYEFHCDFCFDRKWENSDHIAKPRYKEDEIVYIGESWCVDKMYDVFSPIELPLDIKSEIIYTLDGGELTGKKRSAMFLPEKFARYFIRIKKVRIERVQDISENECIKEGINPPSCPYCGYTYIDCQIHLDHHLCKGSDPESAKLRFKWLWNSINKKPGDTWEDNPYVFCYEYEMVNSK